MSQSLSPIIKWAGGKEQELKYIIPHIPHNFNNYYEPFVGGGSVFVAINANHYFINDRSEELIQLYNNIKIQESLFFSYLETIEKIWENTSSFFRNHRDELSEIYLRYRSNLISAQTLKKEISKFCTNKEPDIKNILLHPFDIEGDIFLKEIKTGLFNKMRRMHQLEIKKFNLPDNDIKNNIETAIKGALYMYFRNMYNEDGLGNKQHCALFFFIRNYAYSGMFRYNKKGEFNVPYGGIAYNNKKLRTKIDLYRNKNLSTLFNRTTIEGLDFQDFFDKYTPNNDDFAFLDPPYDSEFSTYAQNSFTHDDHKRLAHCLIECLKCKWMMVIKSTPFIQELYSGINGINITSFEKKYQVSFMNRNGKEATHLLIKNY